MPSQKVNVQDSKANFKVKKSLETIPRHEIRAMSRVARCYVYFQTKNPKLGIFWVYNGKCWYTYFMSIWNILWPFGKFSFNLVYFTLLWYIVPGKIWQPWQ
jgi:hypothetical protein